MYRWLLALAAAAVLLLPAAAIGEGNGVSLVAETGERLRFGAPGSLTVHINAQRDSSGDARGHFWTEFVFPEGTFELRGRVTCLTVAGNRAMARGTIEQSNQPGRPVGSEMLLQFADNGEPGAGRDGQINLIAGPGEELPAGCPIIPFAEPMVVRGNYTVHDADATPAAGVTAQ